jgi:hypothetical protein
MDEQHITRLLLMARELPYEEVAVKVSEKLMPAERSKGGGGRRRSRNLSEDEGKPFQLPTFQPFSQRSLAIAKIKSGMQSLL